jgi:phosphate transport system protein
MTQDLAVLKDPVGEMGRKTVLAVDRSIQAMLSKDTAAAGEVRALETEVDAMFEAVNEQCLALLAGRVSTREEVNFVVSSLRIAIELERICDYANQIAKLVQKKFSKHNFEGLDSLEATTRAMQQRSLDMLKMALKAYDEADVTLSAAVMPQDAYVDKHNRDLFRDMICILSVNPWWQEAVMDYHVAIRYVERVADRATNIAELAYYAVHGFSMSLKAEEGGPG